MTVGVRLYHTPYDDASPEGKIWMTSYGFTDLKTLYIFDMNGQTIQMLGGFGEKDVAFEPPIYHKQWCAVPCPDGQTMGEFDPSKVYQDDINDVVYHAVVQRNKKYNRNSDNPLSDDAIIGRVITPEEAQSVGPKSTGTDHLYILIISFTVIGIAVCVILMVFIYGCIPVDSAKKDDPYDEEIRGLLTSRRSSSVAVSEATATTYTGT